MTTNARVLLLSGLFDTGVWNCTLELRRRTRRTRRRTYKMSTDVFLRLRVREWLVVWKHLRVSAARDVWRTGDTRGVQLLPLKCLVLIFTDSFWPVNVFYFEVCVVLHRSSSFSTNLPQTNQNEWSLNRAMTSVFLNLFVSSHCAWHMGGYVCRNLHLNDPHFGLVHSHRVWCTKTLNL